MTRILIIEDDRQLCEALASTIRQYGYDPLFTDGFDSLDKQVETLKPDLILLDIGIPSFDGFYWCLKIRKATLCPIIIISARDASSDQVLALENGADDYVCKPFEKEVLIAKIRSHLRRCGDYSSETSGSFSEKNGLKVDLSRMELSFKGETSPMAKTTVSHKEAIIIKALIDIYPGAVPREMILAKVWDSKNFVDENTLNVNIARIRKKLEEVGISDALETVRGYGYRLIIHS